MALVTVRAACGLMLHQPLELLRQAAVPLLVVGRVGQDDAALTVDGHAVVGVRKVL